MLVQKGHLDLIGAVYDYKEMGEGFEADLYFNPGTGKYVIVEAVEGDRPPTATRNEAFVSVADFVRSKPEHAEAVRNLMDGHRVS